MRRNEHLFHNASTFPPTDQGGDSFHLFDHPTYSSFGGMGLPQLPARSDSLMGFHDIHVQSSEICPRNLIIFDQTENRSQIMFHPTFESHMNHSGLCLGAQLNRPSINFDAPMNHLSFNLGAPPFQSIAQTLDANNVEKEITSYQKENSEDIDALLSLDAEDHEDSDDEEVSTARTGAECGSNSAARTGAECGSNSPESCSDYRSPLKRRKLSCSKDSAGSGNACSGGKRQKMSKMVKALRGIIPGARRMSTVTVLDEAVRHLKSLKLEAKKFGIENIKSYI